MKSLLLGLLVLLLSTTAFGQTLYTFNGGGTTGNWTDPTIWTTDPTGSTSIGSRLPTNNDNVVVTNSFVVSVSSPVASTGLSITIQKGGVLNLTGTAPTFGTLARLAGQGVLRIAQPYFPAITTNDFDDANTGTVEFYDWPAAVSTLPQPTSGQYNNLRLLNTSTTAFAVLLDASLTVNGSFALSRTNTTTFPAGSTYATPAAAATGAAISFKIGLSAASRTLNVYNTMTVGDGTFFGVNNVNNGVHVLNAYADFINNGTVNLRNASDAQVVQVAFRGTSNANFASNGDTDLDILVVDKGIDSQVLLNVTSTVGLHNSTQGNLRLNHSGAIDMLQLFNGVAKLGNNVYLTKISNDLANGYSLGEEIAPAGSGVHNSPTLWIAGATVFNDNEPLIAVYGTYRISGGQFTCKNDAGMVVREDGQVLVEGGLTQVNKFRPSRTSANHRGSFIISNGVFECTGTTATSIDDKFARFCVPYITQSFRMTGGTIRTQVPNPNGIDGIFHIGVAPNNAIVTGGTIEIILPASNINGKILSTAPLWNMTVKKSGSAGTSKVINQTMPFDATFAANATTAAQPLTVQNNFILDGVNSTTFDANSQDVNIQGTFIIGAGATYLPTTNTTTFSGLQNQLLTNNGTIGASAATNTFYNWTIDKPAGTLTLGGTNSTYTVAAAGVLRLLDGVLNDGGKTVNVLGNMVNSASHTSGGSAGSITLGGAGGQVVSGNGKGVFGNLRVNCTNPTQGTVSATLTADMSVANVLTLQSVHILAIGANRLSLTNVNTNAIGPVNTFTAQRMIQTAGNQSDLGLQKTYGGATAFTFPVGTGTKYTPATIDLRLATTLAKYGQVSVSPTSIRSPFVTSTTNSLAYYWKVRSTGFGAIPSGAIFATFRMRNTDAAGVRTSYIPGRYLPVAWTSFGSPSAVSDIGTGDSDISFESLNQFEGEFTAGEPATFGPITAYYSRVATGNWEVPTTWSTTGYNGAAASVAPGAGNPVFIGSAANGANHTVTVTANNARSGSLVIDNGSTLDLQNFTGHNFGALPDSKPGGSGTMRITALVIKSGSNYFATPVFPSGDFGSFLQAGGGTVEYYGTTSSNAYTMSVPSTSASLLNLNSYENLTLNPISNGEIILPDLDLRIYKQLKTGTSAAYIGTANISGTAVGNLQVGTLLAVLNGKLRFANGTTRTLTVDGDVQISSGASFDVSGGGAAVTNNVTVAGSITNNGTLDFNAISRANLTFISSQNTNLTGTTGTLTDLATLTVNKGTGRGALLNLDVAGTLTTPTSGWLTLTNGTLRYAKGTGTLTIHDANSPYLITENAGLTVDAAGASVTVATNTTAPSTISSAASDLQLAGQLQVLQGTLSVGTTVGLGNDLEYASAGAPTIRIATGGTLYVNGQVRRTTANTNGSLRYDQSGGSVVVDGARAEVYQSNERGLFEVQGPSSIFRMSGGTLALRGTNTRPTIIADLYLRPDSTVVTAGTVVLGKTAGSSVTVSVESLVPLYDLKVEAGTSGTIANTGLLTGLNPLNLQGSLTIANDFAYFNANGLGLNIDQNLANNNSSINNGLNDGGFRPFTANQTTIFTGKGPVVQQLTGTAANLTVFGNLVVNNAQPGGTLQLGRNARTLGTLTIAKGTLADNGQTITALGDVLNSSVHTSTGAGSLILGGLTNQNIGGNGKGVFGNVTLNNSAGATTIANQEIANVLTLTTGVLTIGSNLLSLTNPSAGAVAGTFGTTNFIRTNGIVADQGVRKSYPTGASDFTFPIGAVSKYTPVRMNVTGNGAVGTLTVQPIDLAHPSTTDPAPKELSFYWKVGSTGFSTPTVNQVFTYVDNGVGNDVNGTEASYKLGRFLNGAWNPQNGIVASTVNTASNTLTNPGVNYFDGDYTGGEPSEFGAVPTFYSRNATAGLTAGANWDNPASWTFNSDGSDGPTALPTTFPNIANPVVIRSGHLISSNGNSRGSANLTLSGTLDLATNVANNFSTVTGAGTLRIGSALFPAGNYSAFVAATGGTVDFTGAVQLPARDTYNNLTLSGGNTKQLSNLDLTLNGALTIATGTTADNPTSQSIILNSTTSGATVNGTFNLNDGPLTTSAFLTNNGILKLGAAPVNVGTAFTNNSGGTVNHGTGAMTVGTTFSNTGTYNAAVAAGNQAGNITVGTNFSNGGIYNAGNGSLNVISDLTNLAAGIFTPASGDVSVGGNLVNAGNYAPTDDVPYVLRVTNDFTNQAGGSFKGKVSTMILRGNFINNGSSISFDAGTSLTQFVTDVNRALTGSTSFFNLQKLGTRPLTLSTGTNLTVSNILTMNGGVILTGTSNMVRLTNAATQPIVGATISTYIAGRLAISLPNEAASIRVFPVGAGGRFRPVTIQPQGVSVNPEVLVEIINGAPTGTVDATLSNLSANRYYRIFLVSPAGTSITQPTVQLSFNTDVVDEEVNVPGNLRVARSTGPSGPWSTAGGSGVYSPEAPRGYTISGASTTVIDGNSFFALASTNKVDNPLTGSAPLPVELVEFSATRKGSAVKLAWTTASEKNSAYFAVERAADGRTFDNIGRVEAQGNSISRHDYALVDAAPLVGLNYYRLRQVDKDGKTAYSPVRVVRFDGSGETPTLLAFPNPASAQGFKLLAINLGTTGGTVKVHDSTGRLVLTQVVTAAEATIRPAQPLASGLYFVTWQATGGSKLTTKVVVE